METEKYANQLDYINCNERVLKYNIEPTLLYARGRRNAMPCDASMLLNETLSTE